MGIPGTPQELTDMYALTRQDITDRIDELFTAEFGAANLPPPPAGS